MKGIYNEVTQFIATEIKKYTPQLYYHTYANDAPCPIGTSVLIKTKNNFFLVTAAHIFHKEKIKNIVLFINKYLYRIAGELNFHEPNDEHHDPHNLDIAVFKLDYIMVDLLKNYYSFLELQDLELDHFSSNDSRYLVFGYPAQITKQNEFKKTIKAIPMSFETVGVNLHHYYRDNIERNKTIILLGLQNNIKPTNRNSINKISDFAGISSCGVWHVTTLSTESPKYKLVSILTGQDEHKTVFYSTSVNAIRSIIQMNKWL